MLNAREVLLYANDLYDGDWHKIYEFLSTKAHKKLTTEQEERAAELGGDTELITYLDLDYPMEYRESSYPQPPFVVTRTEVERVLKSKLMDSDEFDVLLIRLLYNNDKLDEVERKYAVMEKAHEDIESIIASCLKK